MRFKSAKRRFSLGPDHDLQITFMFILLYRTEKSYSTVAPTCKIKSFILFFNQQVVVFTCWSRQEKKKQLYNDSIWQITSEQLKKNHFHIISQDRYLLLVYWTSDDLEITQTLWRLDEETEDLMCLPWEDNIQKLDSESKKNNSSKQK